jgi:hypothetical protein
MNIKYLEKNCFYWVSINDSKYVTVGRYDSDGLFSIVGSEETFGLTDVFVLSKISTEINLDSYYIIGKE